MALKRRAFLQQAGTALAALGLSETALSTLADRYQQALAQPTRRKLALLVGINQYPESVCDYTAPRGSALNGCLTDLELQQELLIHRFGFQPSDILLLTDQAATRQTIEEAFLSHLVQQAKPGDVVLFHFSGLGSQIQLAETETQFLTSLVPIDGNLPTPENPTIQDLMQDTLGLLLRCLATDQLITVLDTGFTSLGRTVQGNLRIRSRPDMPIGSILPAELEFQAQLASQVRLSQAQINRQQQRQLPGTVLQASMANRVATEAQWNGFSAGLFTYALTQQLWWSTPATTLWMSFNQAMGTVRQSAGIEQQPTISDQATKQILPSAPLESRGAEGVIRAIEEDGKAQLWLAGLPAVVLENLGTSLFTVAAVPSPISASSASNPGEPLTGALLQLRSRDGLTARAKLISESTSIGSGALAAGQFIQEAVRILPRNIGLTVALDTSLERIERVDATSAFSAIPRVSSVIAGEQPADFLFGKTSPASLVAASLSPQSLLALDAQNAPAPNSPDSPAPATEDPPNLSIKSSYGLFYLGRNAIPNSLIQNPEAVKTAVTRLTPQLKTLLAIKLLRLTQNQGSSRLGVRASLELVVPQERLILQQETVRAPQTSPISKVTRLLLAEGSPNVPLGSQIQYRLHNYGTQPVYFMLMGLDTKGNAMVFYPDDSHAVTANGARQPNAIVPNETVVIPSANTTGWSIQNPIGLAETHLIFSRAPFTQTAQTLETEIRAQTDSQQVTALLNPLEVVQAILQDLHTASTALSTLEVPADSYALDVNAWATFSFIYQVVAA